MHNTQVKTFQSEKALNEFLSNHDVISVQALIAQNTHEGIMRGQGIVTVNAIVWNVWYKEV